jgi:hypothetical protein
VSKHRRTVGRLMFVGILLSLSACSEGEIGENPGVPRSNSEADGNPDDGAETSPASAVLQCPGAQPDLAASNGWRSSDASMPADGALRFEVKARPTAPNLNGLVAVGAESIDGFDKAAIAVRFADDGLVDVQDGAFYASDMAYPYEFGVWYSIGILADIDNETYDVEIGPCGAPRETLIEDASFRDDAEVSGQLSTWGVWSSQTAALEVSTPAWMTSSGCAPATCASLGQECGQPGDGCGASLSCGTCSGEDVCTNNVCGPASEESEKPVAATTGANCAAPGCPSATLGSLSAAGANCGSTISVNGTTCENFTTNGSITINADNVTLRNFIVNANGGRYGVYPTAGSSGITVEYGEIYNAESAGLYNLSNNFYAQRLYVHDIGGDAFKIEGNGATVEWSFLEKLGTAPDAHADGNQTRGGSNITFRYNNMWMPAPGTRNYPGPPYKANATAMHCCNISNVVYEHNWLNGGGYTVYCQSSGQNVRGISVRNNLFGRDFTFGVKSGTCDEWSGNRWEDTGEPL